MIQLDNLGKTYVNGANRVEAIQNIDLTIEDGDIYGIIGLSGAGKSTLVRCINFLEKPTEGRVLFDGVNLAELTPAQLRKTRQQMSMIFQSFNLLEQRTALNNVCYPLEITGWNRAKAKDRAMELLEVVGLADRANAYPSQLSGGQKQRVAIARALATNPKVLLCDEATSALDPNTTRAILDLLLHINKTMGVTIIIITHEMKVIEQICNKVAVLDNSRVAEVGYVKDIFVAPKSRIAKELILPKSETVESVHSEKTLRVVFDGNSVFEPIISNMTLECHTPVNILASNTKNIEGRVYGQMVLQLPEDESALTRVKEYLGARNIHYEEEYENA